MSFKYPFEISDCEGQLEDALGYLKKSPFPVWLKLQRNVFCNVKHSGLQDLLDFFEENEWAIYGPNSVRLTIDLANSKKILTNEMIKQLSRLFKEGLYAAGLELDLSNNSLNVSQWKVLFEAIASSKQKRFYLFLEKNEIPEIDPIIDALKKGYIADGSYINFPFRHDYERIYDLFRKNKTHDNSYLLYTTSIKEFIEVFKSETNQNRLALTNEYAPQYNPFSTRSPSGMTLTTYLFPLAESMLNIARLLQRSVVLPDFYQFSFHALDCCFNDDHRAAFRALVTERETSLILEINDSTTIGAKSIANLLMHVNCPTNLTLIIDDSSMGDDGIEHICQALTSEKCVPGIDVEITGPYKNTENNAVKTVQASSGLLKLNHLGLDQISKLNSANMFYQGSNAIKRSIIEKCIPGSPFNAIPQEIKFDILDYLSLSPDNENRMLRRLHNCRQEILSLSNKDLPSHTSSLINAVKSKIWLGRNLDGIPDEALTLFLNTEFGKSDIFKTSKIASIIYKNYLDKGYLNVNENNKTQFKLSQYFLNLSDQILSDSITETPNISLT